MDMNTNHKTGIICIVVTILVVTIIIVFHWQERASNIETLRHNLEVAIDSVELNPADYYGYNVMVMLHAHERLKTRWYYVYSVSKDSTKRFHTIYEIDEQTRTILSGPEISDNNTDTEIAAIFEKDEHTQAILLQLLQFRKIADIGTVIVLHGWVDLPQSTREEDMWFIFRHKGDYYKLTHYTDHEFSPTDTIVHGDWQLRKVEPLPW